MELLLTWCHYPTAVGLDRLIDGTGWCRSEESYFWKEGKKELRIRKKEGRNQYAST
jgi:hypothetical protein